MTNGRKLLILALAISLLCHTSFFVYAGYWILSGMNSAEMPQTVSWVKPPEGGPALGDVMGTTESTASGVKMSKKEADLADKTLEEMTQKNDREDVAFDEKKEELLRENMDEDAISKKQSLDQDVLESERSKARRDAAPPRKDLNERLSEKDIPDNMKDTGELTNMDHSIDRAGNVIMDTGKGPGGKFFSPGGGEFNGLRAGAGTSKYADIGAFLNIALYKYADPVSGEKYFKLTVSAKKDANLKVMPKEIIFLLDSSKSITQKKLEYMKAAVVSALGDMNPGDKFNVVAFRNDIARFQGEAGAVNKKTVSDAGNFVRGLESTGQTDVNNALLGMVETPIPMKPSYVILMSDGRPTTGVTDSKRIIQEITRENRMQRPVFTFGGGERVNKYLLDFTSYQNRAWSRFAGREGDIPREFKEFFKEIKSPILLDVRYRLINLDPAEVYPKFLPDFYKSSEFVLYGRFKDEDVFSMQLLGNANGEMKELIITESLNDAKDGGPKIASEWAFRKIYYLISLDTLGAGNHAELRGEIEALSAKYGIVTPYNIEEKN